MRRLDAQRVHHEGQPGVVLTDPLGLAEPAFVPEPLVPLVALLDGSHAIVEVQRAVERGSQDVPADFVANLVAQLDAAALLESERFAARLSAAVRAFTSQEARPARHSGSAGYPAEPDALAVALQMLVPKVSATRAMPRGLIAPHIDLARGRDGYARAYGRLAECEPAELYVLFGTGHQGPSAPVTGLALDWDTPLGRVRTDHAFVEAVHARLGAPDPLDVFLHRQEHSLEFQVLMLRHVLGERKFAVAGFLTGALPSASGDPLAESYVQELLATFRDAARGKRVCFVAGADLAHVGPHFGDALAIDAERLAKLEREDRARLAHVERGEAGAFHRAVEEDRNADRVCGTTPITLVAALAGGAGELLHYGQSPAEDGALCVSWCSVAFG